MISSNTQQIRRSTKLDSSELYKQLHDKLHELNADSEWRIVGPKIKSRECDIYQASSSCGIALAIKHYSRQTGQAAANQYYALKRCYPTMHKKNAAFCVPKTYFFNKENRILVMEWISGRSLHSQLWNPLTSPQQLQTSLAKTGTWLRAFHSASTMTSSQTSGNVLLQNIDKQKDRFLNGRSDTTSDNLFISAYERLQQFSQEQQKFTVPLAHPHGDFTPANLLLSGGKTVGLDIWHQGLRPIHIDMARMTAYLTVAYPLLSRGPIFDRRGRIENKLSKLFSSYGTDTLKPYSLYFKMTLLAEYLRRWLVISNRSSSFKGAITDRYQIAQIKKQIKAIEKNL
jgi:thiamine kinase-like enzyme